MDSGSKALNIIVDDCKHCTPCKTKDKRIESQYYCIDCEAYYCEECFELHPRIPYLAKHIVLKHDDIAVWSNVPYKCTTHDKNLEFFCGEHKMLCCHVCVSLKHRSCAEMEYILESSKKISAKEEIKSMIQLTDEKLDLLESYVGKVRDKTEINQKSKMEYIRELEDFRSRLNQLFDVLIENALIEMTERFDKNRKYSEEITREMKNFQKQLLDIKKQLSTAATGKEVLIYISLKRGEKLAEEVTNKISEIDITTNKDNFRPMLNKAVEDYVGNITQIAHLEDEQMRQESVSSEEVPLRLITSSKSNKSEPCENDKKCGDENIKLSNGKCTVESKAMKYMPILFQNYEADTEPCENKSLSAVQCVESGDKEPLSLKKYSTETFLEGDQKILYSMKVNRDAQSVPSKASYKDSKECIAEFDPYSKESKAYDQMSKSYYGYVVPVKSRKQLKGSIRKK